MNSNTSNGITACTIACWLTALAFGIFVAAALIGWTGMHGLLAAVIGLIAMLVAGWLLKGMFCKDEAMTSTSSGHSAAASTTTAAAVGAGAVATAAVASASSAPAAEKPAKAAKAPAKKPAAPKPAAKKTAAKSTATTKTKSAVTSKSAAKSTATAKASAKPKAAAPATKKAAAPKSATVAKTKAATKPAAKTAAKKESKPKLYTKAPKSVDDLKLISGVGPKMEETLNKVGVYQFDQVASWKKADVAYVDERLDGWRGRIERDGWVKQAKVLAKGGDTEFSKRNRKKS